MAGANKYEFLVFNVEEPQVMALGAGIDWATYRQFIERLHRSFPYIATYDWREKFDIVLRTNSHHIKLRVDRCSFSLIGYQMETPRQWLEFGEEHRIKGSSFLEMYFDYKDMEKECMQPIESICLGQQQLTSAVNMLATSKCASRDRARSLIIVSLMILEGGRFSCFSNYLAATFLDNLPIPHWMRKPLDDRKFFWGRHLNKLNQRVRSAIEIPCVSENKPDKAPNKVDCDPSPHLKSDENDSDCHHPRDMGPCEDVSDDNPDDECPVVESPLVLQPLIRAYGRRDPFLWPFSEVFFVRVSSIEGKHSGPFYGTIYIGRYSSSQCIYNRRREESKFIQSGDIVLLTGPRKPIEGNDGFFFAFSLMGESFQSAMHFSRAEYDKPIWDEFCGKHCSMSVCYIAIHSAMYATLTVTFVDKVTEGPAHVYGQLFASCGDFGYEIILFQRKAEEHIDARPGEAIMLLRNMVSVPWNSRLVLHAELFEYVDTSFDQEVAKGIMEFPLHNKSCSFEEIIYRESGKIRVKVVWRK